MKRFFSLLLCFLGGVLVGFFLSPGQCDAANPSESERGFTMAVTVTKDENKKGRHRYDRRNRPGRAAH